MEARVPSGFQLSPGVSYQLYVSSLGDPNRFGSLTKDQNLAEHSASLALVAPSGAAGATGATGATGPAGAKGATGATGAAGTAGAKGATGATGAAGAKGATGATGAAGAAGAKGATGATGVAGTAGAKGATGATGATGAQGLQGVQGPQGIQGLKGATGATGATGPTGATGLAGATGATGAEGGLVSSFQGAWSSGSNYNAGAVVTHNGSSWLCTASTPPCIGVPGTDANWTALAKAGATGATGAASTVAGPAGATGATGVTGATGPAGPQGATGATGSQGPAGATGPAGPQGPTGATGAQGPQGLQGLQGLQGPAGATGATGSAGAAGAAGIGVPAGGTAGQVLSKVNGTDYNTQWTTPASGGGGGAAKVQLRANKTGGTGESCPLATSTTPVVVAFNNILTSPSSGNTWDGSSFTVGSGQGGLYLVQARLHTLDHPTPSSTVSVQLTLSINNAAYSPYSDANIYGPYPTQNSVTAAGTKGKGELITWVQLADGDSIKLYCLGGNSSTAPQALATDGGSNLMIVKMN
ncbi:collagen-like protein [Stagnimonas aquatica]|uniref:Collagen-like protein n=2 Tax=Stagnimonas aquatica TaxID=2689987 RepID=A0A3N0VM38_9GAMM|nr:collagen-like protein [Stagnimonas aquatica]